MKKLRTMMILILTFILMTGCAGGEDETSVNNKTPQAVAEKDETAESSETEKGEVVKLKFYTWEGAPRDILYKEMAAEFNRLNPNIEVEVITLVDNDSAGYKEKVDLMLLSGDDGDIIAQASSSAVNESVLKGFLEPLNVYIEQEGIVYDNEYALGYEMDGVHYGLPSNKKFWFVLMNKSHLEEAGLELPSLDWTWKDYKEYATVLTQGEGQEKRYGSFLGTQGSRDTLPLWSKLENTPFYNPDGSLRLDDPIFKEITKYRYDLEMVDEVQQSYYEIKSLKIDYRSQFYNEKISMIPIGSWMIGDVIGSLEKYPHDFEATFAPLPKWEESDPTGMTFAENEFLSINTNSKHKEEAYKFIRFATTQGQYMINGIPCTQNADMESAINNIIGDDPNNLLDEDALIRVLNNPEFKNNTQTIFPPYHSQIGDMFHEEVEAYLVGGQDLDTTFDNINKRGKEIVDSY